MADEQTVARDPMATLRRFVRPRARRECCELCGLELGEQHQHLIELSKRRLACCCDACAILFDGQHNPRYRRVPRDVRKLDFQMSDAQWEDLHLPINLAFFYFDSAAKRVVAMYPSPAGATESTLTLEAWEELAERNPVLREMKPDVEGLLVNRIGQTREYWGVPIDECFKLVGVIRTHWRGLSGGAVVWGEIARFFEELKRRGDA
jgi:hypothetical protein